VTFRSFVPTPQEGAAKIVFFGSLIARRSALVEEELAIGFEPMTC
jgi:hypothetical protein